MQPPTTSRHSAEPDRQPASSAGDLPTTPPPRRVPGPIRLWGALLLLASGLPLYLAVITPYQAARAGERITLLGTKPLLIAALLLVYGLAMLIGGTGFTRLRDRLPRVGKAYSLDMVILVVSVLLAYVGEHEFRVVLNAMGYPVPTAW
jgi:predicted MFS family arabinose efflux permease